MPHCETCKHRNTGGECRHPKLHEEGEYPNNENMIDGDHLIYSYSEGGTFWVGPKFGCVHHIPSPKGVL